MLEVKAERIVTRPEYQVFTSIVRLNGHETLTPKAARGALEVAFGQRYGGRVWSPDGSYYYQVYEKSARKVRNTGY
jgi:hypothetical protein